MFSFSWMICWFLLFQLSRLEALSTPQLLQLGCRSINLHQTNDPTFGTHYRSGSSTHCGFVNCINDKCIGLSGVRNVDFETKNSSRIRMRLNMGLTKETHFGNTDAEQLHEPIQDKDGDAFVKGDDDEGNGSGSNDNSRRKLIQVSSEIELPFSAEVAYEAYSDLTRQPSWSSWLESVVVLNDGSDSGGGSTDDPKVESKWTSKIMGIRYSWTAEAVQNERPHTIRWKSVTGLRNEGIVRFHHSEGKSYDEGPTLMTLQMVFVTPRAVTSILRRSKRLSRFVEEQMIARSLQEFRDIVLENDVANGVSPEPETTSTTA